MIVRLRIHINDATRRAMAHYYGQDGLSGYSDVKDQAERAVKNHFKFFRARLETTIAERRAMEED